MFGRCLLVLIVVFLSGCVNNNVKFESEKKSKDYISNAEVNAKYDEYKSKMRTTEKLNIMHCSKKEIFNYEIKCAFFNLKSAKEGSFSFLDDSHDLIKFNGKFEWVIDSNIIKYKYKSVDFTLPEMKSIGFYYKDEIYFENISLINNKSISFSSGNVFMLILEE